MREGYKKTEVGVIPEDWEAMLLSDICEINPRKDILENDDEVAFLPMEQVSNSGRIIKINTKKYEDVSKGYTPFKNKDVLLAKITPCFENGKRALVENLQYKMGFGSTEFHVLRSLEERVIPQYLYYCVDTHRFKELAERNMTGSAGQKRVPTTFLKDYKLSIPPLREQEKIAEILSTVDSQIDDTEKLIEKSKELKKGLMQKLLTKGIGHSEFKKTEVGEIPVEWEVKKLGDIGDAIIGLTYSPEDLVEDDENGILVLRSSNISENSLVFKDNKYVNKNIPEKLITRNGDILICSRNGSKSLIGKSAYIDYKSEGSSFGAFMTIYRSRYNKFLIHLFNSYIIKRQIFNNLGATINQITTANLKSFKVPFPIIEEQIQIGEILYEFDAKIEAYQNKKEKLEELKKGLMQQLLTGKIRTV